LGYSLFKLEVDLSRVMGKPALRDGKTVEFTISVQAAQQDPDLGDNSVVIQTRC
jgi:hypothetical protein